VFELKLQWRFLYGKNNFLSMTQNDDKAKWKWLMMGPFFPRKVCVPKNEGLIGQILRETHKNV